MTEQEIEAKKIQLQQWALYVQIAGLALGLAVFILNSKQFKTAIGSVKS